MKKQAVKGKAFPFYSHGMKGVSEMYVSASLAHIFTVENGNV